MDSYAERKNMRERPYIDWKGGDLVDHFYDNEGDFDVVLEIAHELMFRKYVSEETKSDVIERLKEFYFEEQVEIPPPPDFPFPSTDVQETREKLRRKIGYPDWQEIGLLRSSGYKVGQNGIHPAIRMKILNYIFLADDLSDVDDKDYASEWGEPKTSERLYKLAHTIAALTRNAKRHPHDKSEAISDWEQDLEYLRETFYEGWGDFPWPDVEVNQAPCNAPRNMIQGSRAWS